MNGLFLFARKRYTRMMNFHLIKYKTSFFLEAKINANKRVSPRRFSILRQTDWHFKNLTRPARESIQGYVKSRLFIGFGDVKSFILVTEKSTVITFYGKTGASIAACADISRIYK